MAGLLIASSPVEIQALADESGLDEGARTAALRLFHRLTSQLELDAIAMAPVTGEDWPRHRLYFGEATGPILRLQAALVTVAGLADATNPPLPADGVPNALFIEGRDGPFAAVLLAGHDAGWLSRVATPLEQAAG